MTALYVSKFGQLNPGQNRGYFNTFFARSEANINELSLVKIIAAVTFILVIFLILVFAILLVGLKWKREKAYKNCAMSTIRNSRKSRLFFKNSVSNLIEYVCMAFLVAVKHPV